MKVLLYIVDLRFCMQNVNECPFLFNVCPKSKKKFENDQENPPICFMRRNKNGMKKDLYYCCLLSRTYQYIYEKLG